MNGSFEEVEVDGLPDCERKSDSAMEDSFA